MVICEANLEYLHLLSLIGNQTQFLVKYKLYKT
jgi:hypothetical protein